MKSYYLALALSVFILACDNEDPAPQLTNGQKQLQSIELHYPWDQIVFDSLFYRDEVLTLQKKQSTTLYDIVKYIFEYSPSSTTIFFEENGNPPRGFMRKDILNDDKQLIQTIINKSDGTLAFIYDFVYDADGTLIAQHITEDGLQKTDSIKLDAHGNRLSVERVNQKRRLVMTYDENPNPFYQSPLLTGTFQTNTPNNITNFRVFLGDSLFYERTYQYQYGPDDYPTQAVVQGSWDSDPEETHYFYYRE